MCGQVDYESIAAMNLRKQNGFIYASNSLVGGWEVVFRTVVYKCEVHL